MEMKKIFLGMILMSFVCFLGAAVSLAEEAVRVGIINAHSGPMAGPGKMESNAELMAIEDYGPVLGKKVEVFMRDNAFQAGLSVEKAKELYEKEKVDVIFGVPNTAGALGVSDQAFKNKKLFFSTSTTGTELIARNRATIKWVYHNYMLPTAIGTWGGKLGKKFYTITGDYSSAKDALKYFSEVLVKKDGQLIGNDFVPLGTNDFSPYVLKAKNAKPDVLIIINVAKDTINCTKAVVEYGLKKDVKLLYWFLTETDIKEAGVDIFSGGYCAAPWNWTVKIQGAREFADRFYKKYGSRPNYLCAGGYSAVWQYFEAIKRAGTKETIAVSKALQNHSFKDFFVSQGFIRGEDNLQMGDAFILKVKKPEEVKEGEDYYEVVETLPASVVQPDPKFFGRKLVEF
jgi:branched-chain amino acid transport system substrate-binding protein